jgi:hypothetical protein
MAELKTHGFAAAALELYKGKVVEINTGEVQTTLLFHDHTQDQKSIVRGILKDAVGDALILQCNVNGESHDVLINCWSISALMELKGVGNLKDVYIDEYKRHITRKK